MENSNLSERPDHGHYSACSGRMIEIEKYCRRSFACTAVICLVMLIMTWMTFRFSIISLIPNLLGDGADLGGNMVQTLIIIGITVMSALAIEKYKIFNVIIFFIYCAMLVGCVVSRNPDDLFTVFFSVAGIIFSFRSISVFLDYRQLSRTEGFPEFNERLAYQQDHREYIPDHPIKDSNRSSGMDEI